jgi:hypothetical protein
MDPWAPCKVGFPGVILCHFFLGAAYCLAIVIVALGGIAILMLISNFIFFKYYQHVCKKRCKEDPNALSYH